MEADWKDTFVLYDDTERLSATSSPKLQWDLHSSQGAEYSLVMQNSKKEV